MPTLTIISRDGTEREIQAQVGLNLMEVIRDNGISGLMALCGGSCSCATCHVHIENASADLLPAVSEYEEDLLDSTSDRDETSRLSCQIPVTEAMGGLRVRIAADEWA